MIAIAPSAKAEPGFAAHFRTLCQAGVLPWWRLPVLMSLALLAVWEIWQVGRAETSPYFCLLLTPFLAGTGVLGAARLGRLDLISGTGAPRRRILAATLAGTVLPVAATLGIGALVGRGGAFNTWAALGGFLFAFGVGFLGGLWGPASGVGIVWLMIRAAFLLTASGQALLRDLQAASLGGPALPVGRLALALSAVPELLVEPGVPAVASVFFAIVGILCVVVAFAWFERADWPGKRMS